MLTTVYSTSLRNSTAGVAPAAQAHQAMAHGIATAFIVVAAFLAAVNLVAILALNVRKPAAAV
ncbi:hypothetical protein FRACA_2280010 [Frankia canadensis]|uniref:Uncharacterized protein n=1 Tax=Frankia canadensis TaxID=1836972 RepID=A0A2I2KRA1_9ACTN|nr:hypothetical protein [Frankia canadensis]SNQ48198.1 hypothetical protein FRACA_2280010 [Frankia canadensis]SOU55488.1 hypothetical protein FRACA_2280010 [Frankia canadensis]